MPLVVGSEVKVTSYRYLTLLALHLLLRTSHAPQRSKGVTRLRRIRGLILYGL